MSPKSKLGRNPFEKGSARTVAKKATAKKSRRPKAAKPGPINLASLLKTLQTKGLRALGRQVRSCALDRAAHLVSRFA